MNYSEMLALMKNPISMESKRQESLTQKGTIVAETGQIMRGNIQIGEASGHGRLNILRYEMPGKGVKK